MFHWLRTLPLYQYRPVLYEYVPSVYFYFILIGSQNLF